MKVTIIQQKIFDIRGQNVMLDFDLAELYGVETKRLNEQVKRNIERFPEDFMFRLTKKEWDFMRSQIATASGEPKVKRSHSATASQKKRNISVTPYAFTEHGVTMLANVLKSKKAIKMSIAVVRAFISLKQLAIQHKDLAERLDELRKELHERIGEHDTQLSAIYDAIENLLDDKIEKKNWEERERIGYRL
jgi:phage regulator Rha-like protein